ncbi:MAG TPA: hypothetical protein VJ020_09090 [Anaerolineales bacterium]|nr:hypothetical protein [Anaerolineales bacterium]
MTRTPFILAAILLAACSAPTPTLTSSPRIFSDDFSQDLKLWETFAEPGATSQIIDGHLQIMLTNPAAFAFTMAAINVTDFDLTVNTALGGGGQTNSYGVIFRYIDNQNFYRFDVAGDGMWGLSRRNNDQWISLRELEPASAINTGAAAANALRIVARASEFTFYANGVELGRLSDNTLPVGRVGLFVSTFDDPNAQVSFDDMNIVKP